MSDRVDRTYVIRYTLLFIGMSGLVFFPFILTRHSLVNKVDGFSQYIVYLRYMGQYLRSAVRQFLQGSFRLPSYDFSIGMGDDIGQIVRFHPLDFLSVFVPSAYTEILYEGILLLRFYLAGLTFSFFAFSWNRIPGSAASFGPDDGERIPSEESGSRVCAVNVLSGAMVYVFCGFMLIRVVNHPIYAAPFIVFPMILLGAEKAMHREGFLLFIFSVFLGFWSNYYFMYIMSAALLVYILVRFWEVYRSKRAVCFFFLFWKMTFSYLLGLAMSMITLYPMICRYLSSARMSGGAQTANLLVYADKRRYVAWFLNLISPYQSSGNGTNLNFAVIVLPCFVMLFSLAWKRHRSLKILSLGCLLILLIPGAGYVLAFFNRENSRWMFLLALCCAMAVVFTVDCFACITQRQLAAVGIVSGGFLVFVVLQTVVSGKNLYNLTAAFELAVCLVVLLSPVVRRAGIRSIRSCALVITCGSVVLNGFMTYAPGFGNLSGRYIEAGKTGKIYEDTLRSKGAELIGEDSFFRVEGFTVPHGTENGSVYSDYNGTAEYNSILNTNMIDALMSQNNLGLDAVTTMKGLDSRPVTMNLAHVRYFIAKSSYSGCIPYGFEEEPVVSGEDVSVYECENPLSFGYSSGSFITRENYDALSMLEREMVQLDAVVVEKSKQGQEDPADVLRSEGLQEITGSDVELSSEELALPQEGEGFTCPDKTVHAGKMATMVLSWTEKAGMDAYLLLPKLKGPGEKAYIRLRTKGFKNTIAIRGKEQLYYTGRQEYLIHLGYSDADQEQIMKLTFMKAGDYDLSDAQILYVPMEGYDKKIEALKEQPLMNEEIRDGQISGSVSFDAPRILVLSVPAAEGWTVKVDGEKASPVSEKAAGGGTLTANVMYQGILLPAGEHTIELSYETPGSAWGYAIALPALLAYLVLLLMHRHFKRKETLAECH